MQTMTCTVIKFSISVCVLTIATLSTCRSWRRKQKWRGRSSSENKQDIHGKRLKENANKDKGEDRW